MNHQPEFTENGLHRYRFTEAIMPKWISSETLWGFNAVLQTRHSYTPPRALLNHTTVIVNHHLTPSHYSDCKSGGLASMRLK